MSEILFLFVLFFFVFFFFFLFFFFFFVCLVLSPKHPYGLARLYRCLAPVIIEPALRLAAQPTGFDIFGQQRAGAIFCIRQPVMQNVHNGKAGVQTNKVRKLQWPHRMVRPQLHRTVDRLDVADPFVKRIDRLVDHWHQDAVHDEGGKILDLDLPETAAPASAVLPETAAPATAVL